MLQQFGQLLKDQCRASDLACRFGGEEFVLVVPSATREASTAQAERILQAVREMKVSSDEMVLPRLTVSIGIALYPEHGETTENVIRAADQALYAAKEAGRDRYVISALWRENTLDEHG